jgi:O-antigen ligase
MIKPRAALATQLIRPDPMRSAYTYPISPAKIGITIIVALLSLGVGAVISIGQWEIPLAALLLLTLIIVGLERPALFLAAVLLVRPLLDAASTKSISVGAGAINIGGGIGLVCLAVLFGYLLLTSRVVMPPVSRVMSVVVMFSALSALYAYENAGTAAGTKAIAEVIRLGAILAVFVLAGNVAATSERVRQLFAIVALSAVIPATVAIIQYAAGAAPNGSDLDIARPLGTFVGPNPLGEYCALSLLIFISAPPSLMKRNLRIFALVIVAVGLIITYSRSGYGELLIGLVFIEYRRLSGKLLWAAIVATAILLAVPSVRNRVLPTGNESTLRNGPAQTSLLSSNSTYGSLGWRFQNWNGLIKMWEQSPVLGFGLATTQQLNPTRFAAPNQNGTTGFAAHSAVVRALFEGGLILFSLWMLLYISLIVRSATAAKKPWSLQPYARIILGAWIAIIATGFASDDPFAVTTLMYSCFALTGAIQAAYCQQCITPQLPARPRLAP